MPIFGIILKDPSDAVRRRVFDAAWEPYELCPTFFLVSTKDVAEVVATRAGIKGTDQVEDVSGVVFQLHRRYSGFTTKSLWDWLNQHESDF